MPSTGAGALDGRELWGEGGMDHSLVTPPTQMK